MAEETFLEFIRQQAHDLREQDQPPASLTDWQQQRTQLRERLIESWGGFPNEPCDLEPQLVGTLERDGYRIEKLLLQTRPGVWMTANAYVPTTAGRHPAVLCVHGHFRQAKQQPEIQSRCIGLVKLGFFVLVVDAFGAGERGIGKALGEYHGEMVAATLWPSGLALAGLQVYENMRAVDYLQSRPEVDPDRLGVTGASGGGNQTMYVGAMDDRLKAVVPVCSVGRYQAYLGPACCMCEVTPGALSYTEEGAVLGLVAPRVLMIINATKDGIQFSVDEAAKSLAFAQEIFSLYDRRAAAKQTVIDSGHGYNQQMREAMYGWMSLHLKGEGDGGSIPEPDHTTEEPEDLRCFPGESRPDDYVTLPRFAAQEGRRLLQKIGVPNHADQWSAQEAMLCKGLAELLGPFPQRQPLNAVWVSDELGVEEGSFEAEPGMRLTTRYDFGPQDTRRLMILEFPTASKDGDSVETKGNELFAAARKQGWSVVRPQLRATGDMAWPRDNIGRAPDHTTAEWSLWLGRPLLAQWVWDVTRLLDALDEREPRAAPAMPTAVVGIGPAGLIALCAASLTTRIQAVATVSTLASFLTDAPYTGQRMGTFAPGILRDVGDVAHIAATLSPRRLVISDAVNGQSQSLEETASTEQFRATRAAYQLENAADQFHLYGRLAATDLLDRLA
ncbi:MAG: acetylxylan esterase [Planctomycetaceae bacterium]|nr:acetylxylan esterase [Planctomycetaceae bacterium]